MTSTISTVAEDTARNLATYFTWNVAPHVAWRVAARLIALVWGLVFNVFPHETDVSARAIKEF